MVHRRVHQQRVYCRCFFPSFFLSFLLSFFSVFLSLFISQLAREGPAVVKYGYPFPIKPQFLINIMVLSNMHVRRYLSAKRVGRCLLFLFLLVTFRF